MRTAQGFTLLELLITLAVAGILLVLALPAFRDFVLNNRITAEANDLVADLMLARSEAAKRGVRVEVCASSNGSACGGSWSGGRIVFVDANGNGAVDGGEEVLKITQALPSGTTLASSGFANAGWIQYRPMGNADSAGSFKLCDTRTGDYGRLITVALTGRASVSDTSCP